MACCIVDRRPKGTRCKWLVLNQLIPLLISQMIFLLPCNATAYKFPADIIFFIIGIWILDIGTFFNLDLVIVLCLVISSVNV